ncbi:DUF1240 domain-containing protein [Yersinia pseudotuberculosis]|uniref:DUF1240 domain-containing protein n=1 Tax=Yersinia pseudotuberculosis TaxID=633 RepID=UPI000F4F987D|nr:DUF1240 domain-containing protein [Yersinia pseudotuberculosis]AYX17438.1 DUF1240 domain-containing protein [Yersinia pseudotuberculosis]
MKNRLLKTLGAIIVLLILTPMMCLVNIYIIELIKMEDEITFSASIFISFISSPLVFYALVGSIYVFIFNRMPKFKEIIIKYLAMLMIASFIVSLPVSFYVDYKLKSKGYVVCDRISWMSPNTYVKDLSLCK